MALRYVTAALSFYPTLPCPYILPRPLRINSCMFILYGNHKRTCYWQGGVECGCAIVYHILILIDMFHGHEHGHWGFYECRLEDALYTREKKKILLHVCIVWQS